MKIAIICWAGRNNAGDERMFWCLKKYFKKHTIISFETWKPAESKIDEINACDYVLFGGGTLIRRNFNDRYDFIEKITRPIGFVGITVEANKIHDDMRAAVGLLLQKADFIYVRDKHSQKVLYNHPKVFVGPDITFLYPFSVAKIIDDDRWALNILNWHWWDAGLYSQKHTLLSQLEEKYPNFKKFYPGKKWDLDKFIEIVKTKCSAIEPFPLWFDKDFISGDDLVWKYFQKKIKKFTLVPLQKSRYLIGMRYHGILFACQMGIPFISLSYEHKNTSFCKDIGLPQLSLTLGNYKKINQKIKYVSKNYSIIRTALLSYRKKAKKEIESIFAVLEKHIEIAAESHTTSII